MFPVGGWLRGIPEPFAFQGKAPRDLSHSPHPPDCAVAWLSEVPAFKDVVPTEASLRRNTSGQDNRLMARMLHRLPESDICLKQSRAESL